MNGSDFIELKEGLHEGVVSHLAWIGDGGQLLDAHGIPRLLGHRGQLLAI